MTPEQKSEALRMIRIHWDTSVKRICEKLDIQPHTLYRMLRHYRKNSCSPQPPTVA